MRGRYFKGKRASIPNPPHCLSTGSVVRLVRIPRSIHDGDCNISRAAAQKGDIILSKQRYFFARLPALDRTGFLGPDISSQVPPRCFRRLAAITWSIRALPARPRKKDLPGSDRRMEFFRLKPQRLRVVPAKSENNRSRTFRIPAYGKGETGNRAKHIWSEDSPTIFPSMRETARANLPTADQGVPWRTSLLQREHRRQRHIAPLLFSRQAAELSHQTPPLEEAGQTEVVRSDRKGSFAAGHTTRQTRF